MTEIRSGASPAASPSRRVAPHRSCAAASPSTRTDTLAVVRGESRRSATTLSGRASSPPAATCAPRRRTLGYG